MQLKNTKIHEIEKKTKWEKNRSNEPLYSTSLSEIRKKT